MENQKTTDPVKVVAAQDGMHIVTGTGDSKKGHFALQKINKWAALAVFIVVFGGIGSYLLFASHADPLPTWLISGTMAVSDSGTKKTQLVLPSASSNTITISPNGQRVAYTIEPKPDKLMVANVDGSNAVTVATLPNADSSTSYYPSEMVWSPDGTRLAMPVSSTPTNNGDTIWVVNADGSGSHDVTIPDGGLHNQRFSILPKGGFLYAHGKQLCTIGDDGTNNICTAIQNMPADNVTPSVGCVTAASDATTSPDQTKILVHVQCGDPGLYSVNPDGTGLTKLWAQQDKRVLYDFAWSPDGSKVGYLLATSGTTPPEIDTLYTMNADGSAQTSLGVTSSQTVSWGAANDILNAQTDPLVVTPTPVSTKAPLAGGITAYMYNSLVDHIDPITKAVTSTVFSQNPSVLARVSPDGKRVAYGIFTADKRTQLIVENVDGSNSKVIYANRDTSLRDITWSSDSQLLAFVSASQTVGPSGNPLETVAAIRADGSSYREVSTVTSPDITFITGLTWFPGSTKLLYVADNTKYCTVDANNTGNQCGAQQDGLVQIATAGNVKGSDDFPVISPDGAKVLISPVTGEDAYGNKISIERQSVYVTNIDGSNAQALAENGPNITTRAATWSPDGKQVAYAYRLETNNGPAKDPTAQTALKTMNADGTNKQTYANLDLAYSLNWQSMNISRYTALAPARIADTRTGSGQNYAGHPFGTGTALDVQVSGKGGVPATGVSSVVLNVTAIGDASGYVSVYPTGAIRPNTSTLDISLNTAVNTQTVATLGTNGQVTVYNSAGATNVILDVVGYYSTTGGSFTPVVPARITDTRSGSGQANAGKTLAGGNVVKVATSGKGGVPAGATGVVVDVTVTNNKTVGYLTLYPSDVAKPATSSMNYVASKGLSKEINVKLAADGTFNVYNSAGSTDAIVDVVGYYTADATGIGYVGLLPTRIVDTRSGLGGTHVGQGQVLTVTAVGQANVPAGAAGVVLGVTVPNSTIPAYLKAYPSGSSAPTVSNVTYQPGTTAFGEVTVKLGTDGKFNLQNSAGTADFIVDVLGYYY